MPVLVDATTRTVLVDTDTRKVLFQQPACSPPIGDCVHYIQFQVKLTADDIANDYSDLFDLFSDDFTAPIEVWLDSEGGWTLAFPESGFTININAILVPIVADQYYDVLVAFQDFGMDYENVKITFCVNGVTGTPLELPKLFLTATTTYRHWYVGDRYGGDNVVNRRYRRLKANPGFNIATDSFDSLLNATVSVEGGENVLLVDSGSSAGYGLKDDLTWVVSCGLGSGACCVGSDCSIRSYHDCVYDVGGTYHGDGVLCSEGLCGPPPPGEGGCCVPICIVACNGGRYSCTYVTALDCASMGGSYNGDGSPCNPDSCATSGNCCGAGEDCCGPTCADPSYQRCCETHACPSISTCCGDGTDGPHLCCDPGSSCCGNGNGCCVDGETECGSCCPDVGPCVPCCVPI